MPLATCPICRKKFETAEAESLPFCSKRCKEVDLARWLGERYSFPTSRHKDDEEEGETEDGTQEEEDEE